jgi:hypothetical protein
MARGLIDRAGGVPMLVPAAWILGGALGLWLAFGHGFAQYDTFYALLWGNEIAHGLTPDLDAPLAPTPHPLATFLGLVLSPLGDGAEDATVAIAFLSLAAVGYLTYRLGERWFNPATGLLAAAIVLSREPMLSDGVRAYVDIPYIALVLGALLVETRRHRAGVPVLVLLGLAGLLRPEAWLFSAAYLTYLALGEPGVRPGLGAISAALRRASFLRLAALAAAAPLIWALNDLLVAGDPLYSLTGTRETVETLGRDTGLRDAIVLGPRRLGEIAREPVLAGAAVGGLLCLALLRGRSLLGAAAGVIAVVGFVVLAVAGLAVITRYLLLAATILAIFCAAGVFGWTQLDQGHPWRRRWLAVAGVVAVLLIAFTPKQVERLSDLQDSIAAQERIRDDLKRLADSDSIDEDCEPVAVPNHRPVPLLALWLDRRPSEILSAQLERPRSGYYFDPATPEVERDFTLDPNDPRRLTAEVPRGFDPVAANRSWRLYARCGEGARR